MEGSVTGKGEEEGGEVEEFWEEERGWNGLRKEPESCLGGEIQRFGRKRVLSSEEFVVVLVFGSLKGM